MNKTSHVSLIIIVVLVLIASTTLNAASAPSREEILERSLNILKRLQYLESRHENVTQLVNQVNTAVQLAQKGNISTAEKILDNVEANVSRLETGAETHYKIYIAVKTAEVATVLSIPVLFYYGFPRLYLYIWFRVRRRWQVKDGSTRR